MESFYRAFHARTQHVRAVMQGYKHDACEWEIAQRLPSWLAPSQATFVGWLHEHYTDATRRCSRVRGSAEGVLQCGQRPPLPFGYHD